MRPPYSRNLFDLLCEQAERAPEQVAVVMDGKSTTYLELERRARGVAAGLSVARVGAGDRVGLLINNSVEWLEICFGAAAIGAISVPFSTWSKRGEIDFLLADSKVKVLFALEKFGDQDYLADFMELVPELHRKRPREWRAERYENLRSIVMIGSRTLMGAESYVEFSTRHAPLEQLPAPGDGAGSEDDALILYTSGSTSYPKAVRLSQGAMIENGFNIGERQGYTEKDRVLLGFPLFWSYGSANAMCATFSHGATLVLQSRFEPGEALDLIERHACTAIYTLPAATTSLVSHEAFSPERTRSLRTGLTIGSAQDVRVAAEVLGAKEICNIYGQTETYGNCCVTWHHWSLERRQSVQGPPLPGVKLRIVDPDTGVPMPQGEDGLVEVYGRVMPGYDGVSEKLNAKVKTADGYFVTGDIARIVADGSIQFVGRSTEMIKRIGINIAPAEVEELLRQHKGVALAGVTGVPDPEKGEIIVAFVVVTPGSTVDCEELRAHCRRLASSYKSPDHIEICGELPVTPTGKVLRRELKAMASALMGHK